MSTYYVKLYPYKEVVEYNRGSLTLLRNHSGKILNQTEFVDELILDGKEYPHECLDIVTEIKLFYKENKRIISYE